MLELLAELWNLRPWAVLIEAAAALVTAGYCTAAFWSLLRRFDRRQAQSLVAEGALNALGFIVCGTLLKMLSLKSWSQIGLFACVFALRTLLKRIFVAEQTRSRV
ncbi:MAG: DUF1622 domain-containing protein [Verrucomicrobiota bacterium]|nr:DUF1622 domain-containing protein [Verrucomicrobiota bacterium]